MWAFHQIHFVFSFNIELEWTEMIIMSTNNMHGLWYYGITKCFIRFVSEYKNLLAVENNCKPIEKEYKNNS